MFARNLGSSQGDRGGRGRASKHVRKTRQAVTLGKPQASLSWLQGPGGRETAGCSFGHLESSPWSPDLPAVV